MPYTIHTENRTLSDPLGGTVLTAADDADLPALTKIADAANGSPSGATALIYAPDLSSFIGTDGEVSIMLSGVEDKAIAIAIVGVSNKAEDVIACVPTTVTAESLGGWASSEIAYSWTYSTDLGVTWNTVLYQGNDFAGAIEQLTVNLGFTPWTWGNLTGAITGMAANHPLANGPARTIQLNTDVEISNNLGSVFFPTVGGNQNRVVVYSCASHLEL